MIKSFTDIRYVVEYRLPGDKHYTYSGYFYSLKEAEQYASGIDREIARRIVVIENRGD